MLNSKGYDRQVQWLCLYLSHWFQGGFLDVGYTLHLKKMIRFRVFCRRHQSSYNSPQSAAKKRSKLSSDLCSSRHPVRLSHQHRLAGTGFSYVGGGHNCVYRNRKQWLVIAQQVRRGSKSEWCVRCKSFGGRCRGPVSKDCPLWGRSHGGVPYRRLYYLASLIGVL